MKWKVGVYGIMSKNYSSNALMVRFFLIVFLGCLVACDDIDSIPLVNTKNKFESIERKLNKEHTFEIDHCHLFYNGKRLHYKQSIDKWVAVLGPYSRDPSAITDMYVWDDEGIAVRVNDDTGLVDEFTLFYMHALSNRSEYLQGHKHYKDDKLKQLSIAIEESWPKGQFRDAIILDGMLVDDRIDMDAFNGARIENELKPFHDSMWRNDVVTLRQCERGEMKFTITLSAKEQGKVLSFNFSDLSSLNW